MSRPVVSTYRLQLSPAFDFDAAGGVADYLAELGVSHLYSSPYLQAVRGSTHGYDVVDHSKVNEELGGDKAHQWLCRRLDECGLGQILDVVPNHMAISGPENTWWWDVLENGPSSRYAAHFDVDWHHPQGPPHASVSGNRVLLPILGDHIGRVVEQGHLLLERTRGTFLIRYFEHVVPVDPRSLSAVLGRAAERCGSADLGFLASALDYLPLATTTDRPSTRRRHRDKEVIRAQLARLLDEQPAVRRAVDEEVATINAETERMQRLLDAQNYRIAFWRVARTDLGYRRFFDVNDLIALRVEDEDVFHDTHGLVLSWLAEGNLDGLRIDHADGLRDPEEYFARLRNAAPESYLVAEKILHPDERLRESWPVDGTTGYDFLNDAGGLFVRQDTEETLTELYGWFTGEQTDYHEVLYQRKRQVAQELLGSDINRVTAVLEGVCSRHPRYRDYTWEDLHEALVEIVCAFPVYRSYVRADHHHIEEKDRELNRMATERAQERRPDMDAELFEFVRSVLSLELPEEDAREFVMRLQQVSAPVMAKGAEDTAFYNYNRLVCLNEVGGEPARFGISREEFHARMGDRADRLPRSMNATSSHDTKRSEDVRMRIAVISEMPETWQETVRAWHEHNAAKRTDGRPEPNTEYLLYQTLVGAWPIDVERVAQYMEKAVREAKTHTSWTNQNADYEAAVQRFVRDVLADESFVAMVERFVERIRYAGWINSLALATLKLTCPGIPDTYQGTDLWDLSLVDPDNRRPVDFSRRRELLGRIGSMAPASIMEYIEDGAPKLLVTSRLLQLRRRRPEDFVGASYRQLPTDGRHAGSAVAYARGEDVVVLVPRFTYSRNGKWGDTRVELPEGTWRNVFTGRRTRGGTRQVAGLTARFPVFAAERVVPHGTKR